MHINGGNGVDDSMSTMSAHIASVVLLCARSSYLMTMKSSVSLTLTNVLMCEMEMKM